MKKTENLSLVILVLAAITVVASFTAVSCGKSDPAAATVGTGTISLSLKVSQ